MKKNIRLKIFDLRCDKYQQNTVLVLVLKDENSGGEILLPISDYEFRCIKNLVLKKEFLSYIDSLGKNFSFKKNELIIQDHEIKSKLTFSTTDDFTQDIILPPIEALLYCADKKIDIFVEENTFHEIKHLDDKARQIFHEEEDILDTAQNIKQEQNFYLNDVAPQTDNENKILCFESNKDDKKDFSFNDINKTNTNNEENFILKNINNEITPNPVESKDHFIDIPQNANIINFNENDVNEIKNIIITEKNVKNIPNENLMEILKNCLADYNYENAILIQEELKNRNIDFRHELCEEDFL